jgi:hypothetical protein
MFEEIFMPSMKQILTIAAVAIVAVAVAKRVPVVKDYV